VPRALRLHSAPVNLHPSNRVASLYRSVPDVSFPPVNEQMDEIRRDTLEIVPEEELARKLERSLKAGKPLVVKQGFDPTRPDLHLGHAVSLRKLRTFQELGHDVVFVMGDYTALIGDPSGRNELRPQLSEDEVRANGRTYADQVHKVLDPARTRIEYNSSWLAPLRLKDILQLTAQYTVARMLERDDFEKRYTSGTPISIMEFLYPLLQGYDSVELKADIELGGTDQRFNVLMGRTLMERFGLEPQVVLIMPLLRGLDGTRKMSKSYDNYIGLIDPPETQFGKTMSIPDTLLEEWMTLVSTIPVAGLADAVAKAKAAPYAAKRALASDIVTQFHGAEGAAAAEAHFDKLFKSKEAPTERPAFTHAPGKLSAVLKDIGFAKSVSEARRMIEQGGVQLDGAKIDDADRALEHGQYVVKYGKLKFADLQITRN
jgi:tyrosyl-tRNA synthetase